jgi:hypothetical protein
MIELNRLEFRIPSSRSLDWLKPYAPLLGHLLASALMTLLGILLIYVVLHPETVFASSVTRLPGDDASDKLEAAGTLLRLLDTGLFRWGARIFAGICIMSSAWALKEQRFGIAIICVIGAILFGTAPKWVKNIFDIGDNQSLFSQGEPQRNASPRVARVDRGVA